LGRIIKKRGKSNLSGLAGNVEFFVIDGETYFKAHAKKHRKIKISQDDADKIRKKGESKYSIMWKLNGRLWIHII
jgi:hypothetical protein